MDWEPTTSILNPAFQVAIDERIQTGIFNVLQRTPNAPPHIPPSSIRQAPRQGLGTEASQPAPPFVPRPPPPPPPQEPPSSPPQQPVENIFKTPTPQPRVVHVHQQVPAGQAPPQGQAQRDDEQRQRELDEKRRRHNEEVQQLMVRAGLAVGAGGGVGGGGGQQPPRVAGGGGGDPDPDSDADSDPEPDHGRHPRRWQTWVRRRAERQALQDAAQYFRGIMPQQQQVPADQRDCKVKDPEPFTGDPEDLERFLVQVDNKFNLKMESNRFRDDVRKIRYAGQLMKDRAHKWYRAYHLQISERDTTRVRGPIDLDPCYTD